MNISDSPPGSLSGDNTAAHRDADRSRPLPPTTERQRAKVPGQLPPARSSRRTYLRQQEDQEDLVMGMDSGKLRRRTSRRGMLKAYPQRAKQLPGQGPSRSTARADQGPADTWFAPGPFSAGRPRHLGAVRPPAPGTLGDLESRRPPWSRVLGFRELRTRSGDRVPPSAEPGRGASGSRHRAARAVETRRQGVAAVGSVSRDTAGPGRAFLGAEAPGKLSTRRPWRNRLLRSVRIQRAGPRRAAGTVTSTRTALMRTAADHERQATPASCDCPAATVAGRPSSGPCSPRLASIAQGPLGGGDLETETGLFYHLPWRTRLRRSFQLTPRGPGGSIPEASG